MDDRFLALDRFAQRSFLGGLVRSRRRLADPGSVVDSLAFETRKAWADHLGISAEDLLLCAGASDAVSLLCRAVLAPNDVAVVAEPTPVQVPAAVLSAGARYVDVGRRQDGTIDTEAAARAAHEHDDAIAWAGGLIGGDDVAALADAAQWRCLFADASAAIALGGDVRALGQGAHAVVIALSDPDADATPVLHAVATCPGLGGGLQAVLGPAVLPLPIYERALVTIERLEAEPEASARFAQQLADIAERIRAKTPQLPGIVDLGRTGRTLAFACLASNAEEVAQAWQQAGFRATAYGGHPMRDLVVFDLAAIASAIDSTQFLTR